MAANQEIEKKDAVRIKVIQHNVAQCDSQCCRFSLAPELTTYSILYNLIARAFNIKREFQTSYLTRDERLPEACWLPLSSDFDLQLAFHRSSDPYLLVKVDVVSNGPFDVSNIDILKFSLPDLPKNNYSAKLPGLFKEKMEKTISIVQKAFNWTEEEETLQDNRPPLTDADFQKMLDTLGTLKDTRELRLRVYSGGMEPSLRKVVWKHLLNVYPDNLTGRQRMDYMKEKTNEYYNMRKIWQEHLETCKNINEEVRYTTNMVRKDVLRTDRYHPYFSGPDDNVNVKALYNILTTYALNHPSVGYCQGMSDLASPLLVTMKDEAQAYVCFCALMSRLNSNFHIDGDAMTLKFQHLTEALLFYDPEFFSYLQFHQADDLLFCYRWLLLELKREFAFSDAQLMLEVLWSSLPPNPPEESVKLVEVPFNPVKTNENSPVSTTPRQNHYDNVCALRRQRSVISNRSAECLSAILKRRAASVDIPSQNNQKVLNRTQSLSKSLESNKDRWETNKKKLDRGETNKNKSDKGDTNKIKLETPRQSPVNRIKEEVISPEESPVRKIYDLSEFKKLTDKIKSPEKNQEKTTANLVNKHLTTNGTSNEYNGARRCFSDSDTDVGVAVFEGGEVDVWQNPISPEDEKIEIVVQEEKPSEVKISTIIRESNKADSQLKESTSLQSCKSEDISCSSINSCEEVDETGWQVSVCGSLGNNTLPPPNEFGGGNPLLMFLCVTLLMQHKNYIMQHRMDHNELAMHFDKMVRRHNVHKVLNQARKMFEAYLKAENSRKSEQISPSTSSYDQPC